jgi:hypothetical protein
VSSHPTGRTDRNGHDEVDEVIEDLEPPPDDEEVEDVLDEDVLDDDVLDDEPLDLGEKVHFDADEPLLPDAESYRTRWLGIQTGFVDEPLYAVESAGRLLTEVLGDLASTFAHKRSALERQWRHGGDTSTDDLRVAFQNYRAFFNRVVNT